MKDQQADRRRVRRFLRTRTERAFRGVYDVHAPALYQMALRLTAGVDAEADEVVQEAWIRAVRRLPDFAWQSSLRTWLIGIAVNVARERRRRLAREERPAPGPLRVVDGGRGPIARVDLERGIAALAPGYREVLLLHDVEGHTHREIGAILGIDEGTSKSQLSRARRALRERLEDRQEGTHARRR